MPANFVNDCSLIVEKTDMKLKAVKKEKRYGFTWHNIKTFKQLKRERLLWRLSEKQITCFIQWTLSIYIYMER